MQAPDTPLSEIAAEKLIIPMLARECKHQSLEKAGGLEAVGEWLGPKSAEAAEGGSAYEQFMGQEKVETSGGSAFDQFMSGEGALPYSRQGVYNPSVIYEGPETAEALGLPFIPLNYALSKIHQYGMEPLRERTVKDYEQLGQPGMELAEAAPEALAPLPSEEEFVGAAGMVLAPYYLKAALKGFQLLGRVGRLGIYRYAPDVVFRGRAQNWTALSGNVRG